MIASTNVLERVMATFSQLDEVCAQKLYTSCSGVFLSGEESLTVKVEKCFWLSCAEVAVLKRDRELDTATDVGLRCACARRCLP